MRHKPVRQPMADVATLEVAWRLPENDLEEKVCQIPQKGVLESCLPGTYSLSYYHIPFTTSHKQTLIIINHDVFQVNCWWDHEKTSKKKPWGASFSQADLWGSAFPRRNSGRCLSFCSVATGPRWRWSGGDLKIQDEKIGKHHLQEVNIWKNDEKWEDIYRV